MSNVWLIATNTLAEIRQQRTVWVALLVAVFVGLSSIAPLIFLDRARSAGQIVIAERLGRLIVEGIIGAWAMAAYLLAGFQGSAAISTEMRSKTIVTLLARPVERWQYLLGRLAGVLALALGMFAFGVLAATLVALYFQVPMAALFNLALLQRIVSIVFAACVSLALSIVLPQQISAAGALALPILPALTATLTQVGNSVLDAIATIVFVLSPAQMPEGLIGSAETEMIHPRYDLFALILTENLLYALAAMVLACWWFSRREIRLEG